MVTIAERRWKSTAHTNVRNVRDARGSSKKSKKSKMSEMPEMPKALLEKSKKLKC